jgi:3',5'-cyclic AMP phosphodiesterase CpdA
MNCEGSTNRQPTLAENAAVERAWKGHGGCLNFRLAHLSDAHIGPIPRPNLAELLGKRVTGYVNWLYKRGAQHDMGVLGRIVADIKAQAPDHVVMTGDIVNIGLPAEIALAKDWLASLGAPGDVSFTPGNHDAYVASVTNLVHDVFAPWTSSETEGEGFPYLRRRGGVALIGLDTGVPTAPFVASGRRNLRASRRCWIAPRRKGSRASSASTIRRMSAARGRCGDSRTPRRSKA